MHTQVVGAGTSIALMSQERTEGGAQRRTLIVAQVVWIAVAPAWGALQGAQHRPNHRPTERAMTDQDSGCPLVPHIKGHAGKVGEFKALCEQFVAKTDTEPKCVHYAFTFDGDNAHCREGYVDAAGLLAHLDNVGAVLQEALKIADITRLEVHAPAAQNDKTRAPPKEPSTPFFAAGMGFRREAEFAGPGPRKGGGLRAGLSPPPTPAAAGGTPAIRKTRGLDTHAPAAPPGQCPEPLHGRLAPKMSART